jgi:hypothetical protein
MYLVFANSLSSIHEAFNVALFGIVWSGWLRIFNIAAGKITDSASTIEKGQDYNDQANCRTLNHIIRLMTMKKTKICFYNDDDGNKTGRKGHVSNVKSGWRIRPVITVTQGWRMRSFVTVTLGCRIRSVVNDRLYL